VALLAGPSPPAELKELAGGEERPHGGKYQILLDKSGLTALYTAQ
jgi:hypothetical protein